LQKPELSGINNMMTPDSVFLKLPDFSSDSTALLIYGAGGHGKTLVELVKSMHTYHIAGLIDDHIEPGTLVLGVPVLGNADVLEECYRRGLRLAVNGVGGIGNAGIRVKVFEILAAHQFVCPAIVHPTAWVEDSAVLDAGVQVLAHAYVGTEAHVGLGTVLNVGVCFSHDVVVGKVTNFSPGAMLGGNVMVGDFTQVGMNATINLGVKVGNRVRIGNGATVKTDLADDSVVRAGAVYPPIKIAPLG
jgi:sugar O-acyltransferase (sialic acid O-acetyltransferase NeuD family)